MTLINFIIPLRDKVMKWAPSYHSPKIHCRLTKRHSTVHASGRLLPSWLCIKRCMKFFKILYSFFWWYITVICSFIFKKSRIFSHNSYNLLFKVPHYASSLKASRTACSWSIPCSSNFPIAVIIFW